MTRPVCVLVLAAFGLAQPGLAETFDGLYSQGQGAICAPLEGGSETVRIEKGVFHGIETECRMENPVDVRDMNAVLYDMQCRGDETAWSARALFMAAADGGLIMVWDGYAFKYDPCPEPGAAPADAAPAVTREAQTPATDTLAPAKGD